MAMQYIGQRKGKDTIYTPETSMETTKLTYLEK